MYFKYPRTPHLPWSPGATSDDVVQIDTRMYADKHVTISQKMDGENCNMYSDHIHARSIDSSNHESRTWVKQLHSDIKHNIPKGWRICGENLFAKHAIHYDSLETYFYVFSIWDDKNMCLSVSDTKEWCELLGLKFVPIIFEGIWSETFVSNLHKTFDTNKIEGYVVRNSGSFHYSEFKNNISKWVRKNHVASGTDHWMHMKVVKNLLKE